MVVYRHVLHSDVREPSLLDQLVQQLFVAERPHLPDRHGNYTAEPVPQLLAAPVGKERNLPAEISSLY